MNIRLKSKQLIFARKWEAILFPDQKIFTDKFTWKQLTFLFVILTILFSFLGKLLPLGGMIGFDWVNFYGQGRVPPFYPPWTIEIVNHLSWPILIGITTASFAIAALRRSIHPISLAVSFFCLPLLWTLFLGQLEGIVLVGLSWMPWLVPLALIKPQVSIFAFGARKKYIAIVLLFLALSFVIWGFWPIRTLNVESFYAEGRYEQNIGIGLWGIPVALIALWLSRGDMDMMMLSGCLVLPHLIPYNLLPVSPAITRLRPFPAFVAVILSLTPLLANFIGPIGWWFGWLFILWLWINLAVMRYPQHKFSRFFAKSLFFRN
ncbi:MAG: hypothetical protein ACYDH1_10795 [Anaerolineaceae bacterium]